MALRRVGADQDNEVGGVEIVVTTGRAIGAKAARIAGHRRTHAKPRVGIKIVAAQGTLHQLVGHVVVLGEELAGSVDGQPLRPLVRQGGPDAIHQQCKGLIPADWCKRLIETGAPEGCGEPVVVQGFADGGALHAHLPQGGGMVAITAGRPLRIPSLSGWLQLQAAAHTAIRTLGPGRCRLAHHLR